MAGFGCPPRLGELPATLSPAERRLLGVRSTVPPNLLEIWSKGANATDMIIKTYSGGAINVLPVPPIDDGPDPFPVPPPSNN